MAPKPSAKKKSPAAKRAPIKKDKCSSCGAVPGSRGTKHATTCPNWTCPECVKLANVIGHAESCTKFKSFTDEAKRVRGTVDSKDAVIDHTHHDPPAEEKKLLRVLPAPCDPEDIREDLEALQQQYDNGDFSGGKQLKEHCDWQGVLDGEEVGCIHVAVLEKVVTIECPTCNRSRKEKKEMRCLPHAVSTWGGGAPGRLQTEMDLS